MARVLKSIDYWLHVQEREAPQFRMLKVVPGRQQMASRALASKIGAGLTSLWSLDAKWLGVNGDWKIHAIIYRVT